MQNDQEQIIITIVAVITVLLFLGILFLILIWAYSHKKQQMERDKQKIQDDFDKQLLQSRLEIQEETFNLISQEIHDNVGQMLSLAKVQLNIIEEKTTPPIDGIQAVKSSIGTAFSDLRNISKSLNSERIQLLTLPDCIREEMNRLGNCGLQLTFTAEGQEKDIGKHEKLILFRTIQEALQNILKHAGAKKVDIAVHYSEKELEIRIADDGAGFAVQEELDKMNGIGLRNMISRTSLIGGHTTIQSNLQQGTTILIIHPYT